MPEHNFMGNELEGVEKPQPIKLPNAPTITRPEKPDFIDTEFTVEDLPPSGKINTKDLDPWSDSLLCNVPIGQYYAYWIGKNGFVAKKKEGDLDPNNPHEMVQVRTSILAKIKSGELQMPKPLAQQQVSETPREEVPIDFLSLAIPEEFLERRTEIAPEEKVFIGTVLTEEKRTLRVSEGAKAAAIATFGDIKYTSCRACNKQFQLPNKPGRPPVKCEACRGL